MISPNQDGLQTIIYNKCEFSEGIWILKRWPAVRMNGMVMSCHVTSRHVLPSWWFHIFCGFQFSIANRWMTTLFIGHRSWTHQPIPIRGWDLCPLCQFAYAAYAWNGSLGGWVTVANNIKGPGAPGRSHSLNSWSPVCKPSWTSLGGLGSSDDPWWLVMVVVVVVVVVVAVLGWVGPRSTRNRPSLDDGGNCPIPRPWLSQTAPAIRSPAATWRISTTWSTFGGSGVARCRRCQCHVGPRRWKVREPQIDSPRLSVEGGGKTWQTSPDKLEDDPDGLLWYISCLLDSGQIRTHQVYMDAVFFPRAVKDPLVLAQEGWHYEIEKKDDPLTFKGGDLGGNITVSLKSLKRRLWSSARQDTWGGSSLRLIISWRCEADARWYKGGGRTMRKTVENSDWIQYAYTQTHTHIYIYILYINKYIYI